MLDGGVDFTFPLVGNDADIILRKALLFNSTFQLHFGKSPFHSQVLCHCSYSLLCDNWSTFSCTTIAALFMSRSDCYGKLVPKGLLQMSLVVRQGSMLDGGVDFTFSLVGSDADIILQKACYLIAPFNCILKNLPWFSATALIHCCVTIGCTTIAAVFMSRSDCYGNLVFIVPKGLFWGHLRA